MAWSNHPNFVLAGSAAAGFLIKLAGSTDSLLNNPESHTLDAAATLRLFRKAGVRREHVVEDGSLWVKKP